MSIQKSSIALILALCLTLPAFATEMARGIVYHDKNGNLSKDKGEEGLKDICVSNGVDVVKTNKEGEYEIARFGDGTISFAIANNDPGWDWIDTGYRASLNAWVHIAWTYSAADGILKIFVNGVQVFSIAGNGNIGDYHPSENDFRIGGRQCCSPRLRQA